jgi:1,4-dihydroxy-2-naphthoyl-CoA hydrolase
MVWREFMAFSYLRIVHFSDTDGAGVVFFANVLSICHEAYEAALSEAEFNLRDFFSDRGAVIFPIVAAEVKFFRPMFCGDCLAIHLTTRQISSFGFEIDYQIVNTENLKQVLAQAFTKHICLDSKQRTPVSISLEMKSWIDKFSVDCAMMGH